MTSTDPEPAAERDSPSWSPTLRRGLYLALALAVAALAALVALGGGVRVVAHAIAALPWLFVALALAAVALEWAADVARFMVAGRAVGVTLALGAWFEVALVNLFAAYVANIGPPVAAY